MSFEGLQLTENGEMEDNGDRDSAVKSLDEVDDEKCFEVDEFFKAL